jgi:hypothetical protein
LRYQRVDGAQPILPRQHEEVLHVEPAHVEHFLLLFASAAAVILLGALYAALYALGCLYSARGLKPCAYAAYAGLCAAVFALAYAANLYTEPLWVAVIGTMLIGYLVAPQAILRLCVSTHARTAGTDEHQRSSTFTSQ